MLPYLAVRGTRPGPLFVTEKGMPLTRQIFSSKIDNVLTRLHIDPIQYNTHSFRIGAATTAAQACIADSHFKTLGRWKSDAFQRYVYKDASTGTSWTILSACFSQFTLTAPKETPLQARFTCFNE